MKRILTLLFALAIISSCTVTNNTSLPRADESELPCDVNVFHNVFNDVFFNGVDELHGLMVLQNGKVIYEEYSTGFGPDFKHVLWSASKTFTATAIGFARQDGLLDVNDKVVSFFGDDVLPEERSEWLDNLTIHHLLCMSACLKETLDGRMRNGEDFDWVKDALSKGFNFEPGSRFFYNSVDSHILSAIVTKVTGKTAEEYMKEKLFDRIGLTDYIWEKCPTGESIGGFGLFMTLESLAKMGQFMLNKGTWNGERLLEEEWFDMAMSPQIMQYEISGDPEANAERYEDDDWNQGYCYQMWKCTRGGVRLDGAKGQLCIIIPEKNAVVATLSSTGNTGVLINSIWKHIYDNI